MAQYYNHMNIIDLFRFDHIVTVSLLHKMLHSWINEGEPSKSTLVHGIDQGFLAV